ncbi:GtrA family protein [Dankookia sp. GCM10030260]|uniref:GtrA family protein n=1 Tax=Dankookia sp. GCM10030260 TaxID=3273390 RepID=UPI00360B28E5
MRDHDPSLAFSNGIGTPSGHAGASGDATIGVKEYVHALRASRAASDAPRCWTAGRLAFDPQAAVRTESCDAVDGEPPGASLVPDRGGAASGLLARARRLPQPARFILAGGTAAGINWLVRIPLSSIMPFLPAVLVAACIGMLVGFVTYREFVFPKSSRSIGRQIRGFLAVNIVTSLIVAGLSVLFLAMLDGLIANLMIAQALAHGVAIGLGAVLNYFGHALVTFGRSVAHGHGLPSA